MATTTEWKILKANPETQRAQLNSVLQDIWNRLSEADRTATAAANTGATLSTIVDDPDSGLRAAANAIRFTTAKVFTLEGTTTAIAEDVTALDARVDDLDTTTSGNSSAINALTARVDVNEGDIAATATDVTALETAVYDPSTGLAATSDAVNTLESRVTVNEGDITVISSDITTLQGRITTAETDINNVESVNTAQGTAISGLDTRLTSAEGTITSHATSLTSLDSRVDTVEIDITDIETVNSGQATAISGLDTRVTAAEGNITSTSSSLTALTSRVDTAESDINAVETVNSGQATAISGLDTRVTSAEGTITAHSSSITQLETDVDGNTAAITAEQTARTTADNALANDREMLAVQLRGSYTGSDLASVTTGLIAQEKTARVSEDEALAQQLTLLSVGVGEQFDYAEIWYFATGVDGWTGPIAQPTATNSWLRPANGSADTRVYSPDGLNVSGTEYPQLRLRIRKTGAPVWDGSFAWKDGTGVWSATNTLTEPAWDSDDIGVVTETVAWSAEVDQLWFELAVNQTATDYYEIDWVAIGRPAPGASSAALSEELAVRAAADAAEVTARELLSTKIIGTTDPDGLTIETLTSGLLYDERSARVTADSAEVTARTALEARVDDTEADITSIQTAYTAADAALASDITSLDTRLTDAEGDIVATSSGLSSLDTRVTTAEGSISTQGSAITSLDSRLDTAETDIAGIEGDVAANATAVSGLDTRVTAAEGTISSQGTAITSLDSRLDTAESDIATKASSSALSALDTRVTSAEGTITSHSSDITTLENDVYHVSTGLATKASTSALNSLDSRVDVTESDIVAITSDVTALETTVNHPSTGVAANASAISSLDTRVSSAEGTITSHSSDITTLENSVFDASTGLATKASTSALNALDSRVDVTESTISTHASDITALQSTVDDPTTGVAANASAVTALDSRLDTAEGTISAHGSDITALEGVIEHPSTGLATRASATEVATIKNRIDSVNGAGKTVEVLASDVSTLSTAINDAGTGLATKASIASLNQVASDLDTAENTISSQATSITALEAKSSIFEPFVPYLTYGFNGTSDGWSITQGAITNFSDSIRITAIGGDMYIQISGLALSGESNNKVRMRLRRIDGTGFDGALLYANNVHGYSSSYLKTLPQADIDRINSGGWQIVEWDMENLTAGGTDWVDGANTITHIRIDLGGNSYAADVFDIDWIEIGSRGGKSSVSASVVQAMDVRVASAEGAITIMEASYSLQLDVNGYVTGFYFLNDGTTSAVKFNSTNFTLTNPAGGNMLSWLGSAGVIDAYNSATSKSLILGPSFGADTDKLTAYFGPAGDATTRTLVDAVWGITASGKPKFGNTGGNDVAGWSSGGTISSSYTLQTPSVITFNVAAGTFVTNGVSISYNAGSAQTTQARSSTVNYYLYYDDGGMAGGTKTLYISTDSDVRFTNPNYVLVGGPIAVTVPATGGGTGPGGPPACVSVDTPLPTHGRAGDVLVGDRLVVGDSTSGFNRMGLVSMSKPSLEPCVRFATENGWLQCSYTAPIAVEGGTLVNASDLTVGMRVPRQLDGVHGMDTILHIIDVGPQMVQSITCENDTFLAGNGCYYYHHNIKQYEP